MKKIILSLSFIAVLVACSSNDSSPTDDGSSSLRKEILTNWADNIIIPAFQNYQGKTNDLATATATFTADATEANLENVRAKWLEAYKAYQQVSLFEVGKAAESNVMLTYYSNTYPIQLNANATTGDLKGINENITTGVYDLTTITSADEQGFPALDYLLYGLGADTPSILAYYTTNSNAANYKQYLTDVVARLKTISDTITNSWTNGYRDTFVNSDGNSVSSSVNKTVNAFVKNFEKNIRAGKVGYPAGIYSNGVSYTDKVEAYYKNDISKELLNLSIQASEDFFNGKHFNDATEGKSLKSYLNDLNVVKNGQRLSVIIDNQFSAIFDVTAVLNNSFSQQIVADNSKMVDAFNALQVNVVYFKLDMMQALNITVDYVDNDGD